MNSAKMIQSEMVMPQSLASDSNIHRIGNPIPRQKRAQNKPQFVEFPNDIEYQTGNQQRKPRIYIEKQFQRIPKYSNQQIIINTIGKNSRKQNTSEFKGKKKKLTVTKMYNDASGLKTPKQLRQFSEQIADEQF